MPVETWNGRRTTISVRLDDEDLEKLDQLVAGGYGAPIERNWGYLRKTRGEALRQALRDAKVPPIEK